MSLQWDDRDFVQAMNYVMETTGKDSRDILNRAGLHAVIGGKGVKGAIQRTPRADKARIQALDIRMLVAAVRRKAIAKGKWPMTREELKKAITRERNRRKSSAGYTAGPGWHNAAVAFGGRGVKVQPGFPKSEAAQGSGKKATVGNLIAEITNTAPAAELIGGSPLAEALDDVARDMVEHAAQRYQKTFNKVNA